MSRRELRRELEELQEKKDRLEEDRRELDTSRKRFAAEQREHAAKVAADREMLRRRGEAIEEEIERRLRERRKRRAGLPQPACTTSPARVACTT